MVLGGETIQLVNRHFVVSELNGTFVEGNAGLDTTSFREVGVIDGHGEAHAVSEDTRSNLLKLSGSLIAVTDLLVLKELENLVGARINPNGEGLLVLPS